MSKLNIVVLTGTLTTAALAGKELLSEIKLCLKAMDLHADAAIAGGLVRDLHFASQGLDVKGKGDVDINLFGFNDRGEALSAAWDLRNYFDEEYGLGAAGNPPEIFEQHPDYGDGRLVCVMKLKLYKQEFDLIFYTEEHQTITDVVNSFDADINKFWFDEFGGIHSLYDWRKPFHYEKTREDEHGAEKRKAKALMRHNLVQDFFTKGLMEDDIGDRILARFGG